MTIERDLPDLSRLTLLAVDDNADALEVLGTILKACGAHVLEARDATDALAYVDTTPGLDAIITDLSMPGMDGVELARKVRQKPFEFDELCRTVHALTAARTGRP
jgi:CheY-like chemotaxis protein